MFFASLKICALLRSLAFAWAWAFGIVISSSAALIVSLVEEPGAANYTNPVLVQGGFGEDALAFTDRLHEWNGVSNSNTLVHPTIGGLGLVGADYVRTANDARAASAAQAAYTLTFSEDARVFLFVDTRMTVPAWVSALGFERIASTSAEGYQQIGYDEAQNATEVGVGPGVSIQTRAWIYTANFSAGTHSFNGLGTSGFNNYGIVATKAGTVVGGVSRLYSATPHPQLQRLGLQDKAKAYVDRNHQLLISNTVANALPGLVGSDYVQLSNDVRSVTAATPLYEISLIEDSYAYLFLDDRYQTTSPSWAWITEKGFQDTLQNAGIDENGDGFSDQTLSIYRTTLSQGAHVFYGMDFGNSNHYILAFHAIPEPQKGLLILMGSSLLCFFRRRPNS